MSNIYNLTDTWNNGATVFSAVKMNVTNTASAAGSKLLDLQVGGVAQPGTVFANGAILTSFDGTSYVGLFPYTNGDFIISGLSSAGAAFSYFLRFSPFTAGGTGNFTLLLASSAQLGWSSSNASIPGDVFMVRSAAGQIDITGATPASSYSAIRTVPVTVANLAAAATAGAGARAFVSDALAPTFGATVAGGGAVKIPVYSDGTNWKVG